MNRLVSTFVLLAVVGGPATAEEQPAGPKTSGKAISLPITDSGQEKRTPPEGWCGEAAIQMALSYYGGYASQQAINRGGKPSHPDLYEGDIGRAITHIGLAAASWKGDGMEAFTKWVRGQLAEGHPVLLGVKIYPTEHPEWALDHFVLAVGCTEDSLTYNTTWGRPQTRTFARLSTQEHGISLANSFKSYFGLAITGLKLPAAAGGKPTRLTIGRDGDKQIKLRVNVAELERGKRYQLLKFTGLAAVEQPGAKGEVAQSFVADGPTATYNETIGLDDVRIYRCVAAP